MQPLDYATRRPRARLPRLVQLWVGIALWVVLAMALALILYALPGALNDPSL